MTSLVLSSRDRRTLGVGAVAVLGIVGVGRGVPALNRWQSAEMAAAAETREQLLVARAGEWSQQEVADSARARSRRLDAIRARLIKAPTAEAAAASLASLAQRVAADQNVDVLSIALKPDSVVRSNLTRVQVRVSAEGDVRSLLDLLYALETHTVPLSVRELAVAPSDPLAPSNRMETLRFDVVVETLARIDPKRVRAAGR